jgi:hypothetical protein
VREPPVVARASPVRFLRKADLMCVIALRADGGWPFIECQQAESTCFDSGARTFFYIHYAALVAQSRGLARSRVDRADAKRGKQIHVMYVLPSDGMDRTRDTDGSISNSVAGLNRWLHSQTGDKALRLDTFHGELDVTFLRLSGTDAEISASDPYILYEIARELRAAGFDQPGKIYAVYYDGSSTYSCGQGPPLEISNNVAAIYLLGEPPDSPACSTETLAGARPGYLEFAMLHEILHALGFVAVCGSNQTRPLSHVSEPGDLMYRGDGPWQLPPTLDIGHDDYFKHGVEGCPDLARSDFLTRRWWPGA